MDSQTQNKRLVGLRTLASDQAKSSVSPDDEKKVLAVKEPALMRKPKEVKVVTPKKPAVKTPEPKKELDSVVVVTETKNKLSDFNKKTKDKDSLPPPPLKSTVDIRIENAEAEAATIITDTKKDRFKLFPAISASIKGWFSDKKAEKAAKRAPKYTVPETTRRQGVIQRATSVTAKSATADHDSIQERIRRREEEEKALEQKTTSSDPGFKDKTVTTEDRGVNSLPPPPESQKITTADQKNLPETKTFNQADTKITTDKPNNLNLKPQPETSDTTWTPNTEPGFPLLNNHPSQPKSTITNFKDKKPPHNFVSQQKEIVINNIKEAKQGLVNQQAFVKKSAFTTNQKPQISIKTSTDTKPNTITTKEKVFAPTEQSIATFTITNPAHTPKKPIEDPIHQSEDKTIHDKNSQSAITWGSESHAKTEPLNIQLSKNIQSSQPAQSSSITNQKQTSSTPVSAPAKADKQIYTTQTNSSTELKSIPVDSERPRAVINIVPKTSIVSNKENVSNTTQLNKLASSNQSSNQSVLTPTKTSTPIIAKDKPAPVTTSTAPVTEINESLDQAVLPSTNRPVTQPVAKNPIVSDSEKTDFKNDFSKTNTNSLVFSVSLALVAFVALGVTSFYFFTNPKENIPAETNNSFYPTVLNLPLRPIYQTVDLPENFLGRIQSEFSQRPDQNYFVFVSSTDNDAKPIQPSALLPFLNIDKNSLFNRSLSFVYFGSLGAGNTFIVLQTTNPTETQGGLLKWESEMYDALSPIIAYGNTASTTPTRFVDGRLGGNDIRVLKDQDGNEHLAYSFITQNTVIITNNHDTLGELQILIKR